MFEFVMIVESEADFQTASEIANRIFIERIEWIEEYLGNTFQWAGLLENSNFSCWRDIGKIQMALKAQGIHQPRFLGRKQPLKSDGAATLKVLQLITQLKRNRDIKAVVFIRDLDNQPERRVGMAQARDEIMQRMPTFEIVIGTADSKREAWVLNGFLPANNNEESMLAQHKETLMFDPTTEAHRLRETTFQEPKRNRNAKVVLDILTDGNHERESRCWRDTGLNLLRERGKYTGLTDYMTEVEERLVLIFTSES